MLTDDAASPSPRRHDTSAMAEPKNFGFTDTVETGSSVVVMRAAGYGAYGRPAMTPPSPEPGGAGPVGRARSESNFTSVTDRLPGWSPLARRHTGWQAAADDDAAAESHPVAPPPAPTSQPTQQLAHEGALGAPAGMGVVAMPMRGPAVQESWCQTSEAPEVRSRREELEWRLAQRDRWSEDFKRQWQSVSAHYGRMINRAERCSPSRSRMASSPELHNLRSTSRSAHPLPAPDRDGSHVSSSSTSRFADQRFVSAARERLGLPAASDSSAHGRGPAAAAPYYARPVDSEALPVVAADEAEQAHRWPRQADTPASKASSASPAVVRIDTSNSSVPPPRRGNFY